MAMTQHGASKKSKNFKEAKKANIRLNEQNQREWQKAMDAQLWEQLAKEAIEWAPKDKADAKFQKQMQEKELQMNETGPSKAELKKMMEDEDELTMGKKPKGQKNGWGKKK